MSGHITWQPLTCEGTLSLSCCVRSGINPRVKSGRFMKILPDYEHMEYRDVYTCRTYLTPCAVAAAAAAAAAWAIAGGGGGGQTRFPPWEMLSRLFLLSSAAAVVGRAEW